MADITQKQPGRGRGPGKPFVKGDARINRVGQPVQTRDARQMVRAALDKAFIAPDGRDMLVDAIQAGVMQGDAQIVRLACEYRWGKAPDKVELTGADGGPVETRGLSLPDLVSRTVEGLAVLGVVARVKSNG